MHSNEQCSVSSRTRSIADEEFRIDCTLRPSDRTTAVKYALELLADSVKRSDPNSSRIWPTTRSLT